MADKWQIIIAECEKLSDATGVEVPAALYPPPAGKPAGPEWADPWQREGRLLDWLAGYLKQVNAALVKEEVKAEAEVKAEKEKKPSK